MSTIFPTLDELLELHTRLIARFGGSPGVRDMGCLESALYRPQTGYYDSLAEQAGALLQSLVMNHGFVDGNKRVSFAMTAIFLRLNGYRLLAGADEAERFMIDDVIVSSADLGVIASWLSERMQPLPT